MLLINPMSTLCTQDKFERLKTHKVDLQNMVYYRSTGAYARIPSHYFVMTVSAQSLLSWGAFKSPAPEGKTVVNVDASVHCLRRELGSVKSKGNYTDHTIGFLKRSSAI